MSRRYQQRSFPRRLGHALWMSIGAILMLGLMLAGLLVLGLCAGGELFGAARP